MNKTLMMVPAILFAGLAVTPAYAVPATSLKEVVVDSQHLVELTNKGNLTLKIVAHPGYNRSNEANPTDNGIVEHFVDPGKAVLIDGPYSVYEYKLMQNHFDDRTMYMGGS